MERSMLFYKVLDRNCLYSFPVTWFSLFLCSGPCVSYGTSAWLCIPSPGMIIGCVILPHDSWAAWFHSLVVGPCVYFFPPLSWEFVYSLFTVHMLPGHPHSLSPFLLFHKSHSASGSSLSLSSPTDPSQTTLSAGYSPELLHILLSLHHSSDN